jgi:hypothetical protein
MPVTDKQRDSEPTIEGVRESDDSDTTHERPTDAGHSDADTQTQRNIEDESPA